MFYMLKNYLSFVTTTQLHRACKILVLFANTVRKHHEDNLDEHKQHNPRFLSTTMKAEARTTLGVGVRQGEHSVVEAVKACQGHELELVAQLAQTCLQIQ